MKEAEPRKESEPICSSCGQPIDIGNSDIVYYHQSGHYYHENHFTFSRPRWQLHDTNHEDFWSYKKNGKKMDIVESYHKDEKVMVRDILLYETKDPSHTMMVRRTINGKRKNRI